MLDTAKKLLRLLFESSLFRGDFSDNASADLVLLYALLDHVEKVCKDRKSAMKSLLIQRIKADGTSPKEGQWALSTPVARALQSDKVAKLPPEKAINALLREKGIPLESVYDQQTEWVLNPSKLERLVYHGHLKRSEVDVLKKVTPSLRVTPSKALKTELSQLQTRSENE